MEKNSADDILHATDYLDYEYTKGANVGNKLWLMGLVSTISTPENEVYFMDEHMNADYINDHFDICIKPEANVFSKRFVNRLNNHVKYYSDINIPIYVIACGVSAVSYDELDGLVKDIEAPSRAFIESIYKTGGEFCLRGNFTKLFFDRLGYSSAVVTGCPSLYQYGRDFTITNEKVDRADFKVAFNGNMNYCSDLLMKMNNSEFFDQGVFYPMLYTNNSEEITLRDVYQFVKKNGVYSAFLAKEDRLQLFIDMQDWMDYLKIQGFNFSCGTRIHGNIMSLLSGIPAVICPPDMRVREMAEFYDIPIIDEREYLKEDLYDIYQSISYERFNATFAKKYDAYEQFLINHHIVETSANTIPLLRQDHYVNAEERIESLREIKNWQHIDNLVNKIEPARGAWQQYEKLREYIISHLH